MTAAFFCGKSNLIFSDLFWAEAFLGNRLNKAS